MRAVRHSLVGFADGFAGVYEQPDGSPAYHCGRTGGLLAGSFTLHREVTAMPIEDRSTWPMNPETAERL